MTSISTLITNAPAAGRGVLTSIVDGDGEWYWIVEIADPSAGASVQWHDITQFWRGHEYGRGSDSYLGRFQSSVATIDLWTDDDSLAPWNDDTSPTFGVHVELGPGLLIRGGFNRVTGGIVTNWNPRWTLKVEEWPDASYSRGKARQHRVTARDTLTSLINVPIPASAAENWSNRVGGIITQAQWPYGALIYGAFTLAGSPVLLMPERDESSSAAAELDATCYPAGVVWYTERTGVLVVRPRVDDTWHAGLFAAGASGTPWTDGTPLDFAWYACDLDDGSFAEYAVDDPAIGQFGVDRSELSIINRVVVTAPTGTFDDDDPISVQRFDPKPQQSQWIVANDVIAAQQLATRAYASLVARPLRTTNKLRGFVPGPWGADYLSPSLVVHRNNDDAKTVTVNGWLRRYRETLRPFGCDVDMTMTFTLDVASIVDVRDSMLPVEDLHVMGRTDIAAEFGWHYPAQIIAPTHVQVRLRPTSSLWMTLPYLGDGNDDSMEWAGLEPESRYQFDVRLVRIVDGLVTDFSPSRTVTVDTLETTLPDTDPDHTTDLPDPGDECDLQWKLEKRVGSTWTFVAGETITEPPYEADLNPYLLDDEVFYRVCVRDICDGVPGAWRCEAPWVLDCQPVSRLGLAPFDDAALRAYWPQVCGTSGDVSIEEAVSNVPMAHGNALVSVGFDDDNYPVLNSGPAGVIGYGVEPFALPVPSDATIACRWRPHTLPPSSGRTLFEYGGLNITAKRVSLGPDPDAVGWSIVGQVIDDTHTIHTVTGSTVFGIDAVFDLALTHDVGGDVNVYVNAELEGTISTIGQRFNFGLYSIQCVASSWITDCALWQRVLDPSELPGAGVPPDEPSGGSVTDADCFRYHTFLADDVFNPGPTPLDVDYLVIGGGAGSGGGRSFINNISGGGGGQCRHGDAETISSPQAITIGQGSAGITTSNVNSVAGDPTVFGTIATAPGGGGTALKTGGASGNEDATTSPGTGVGGGFGSGGGAGCGGDDGSGGHIEGAVLHGGGGALSEAGCGYDWKGRGVYYGGGGTGVTNGGGHGTGTEGRNNTGDGVPNSGQGGHNGGDGGSGIVIVRYRTCVGVTINQRAGQADPATGPSVQFDVVFDVPVTGFGIADVVLSGTAGATTVGVSGVGATYIVTVSGMTTAGTVIATIPAGVATSMSGLINDPSTSTDNTITWSP